VLLQATERDTVLIERSIGNAMKVLRNKPALKALEMEQKGAFLEELLTGDLSKAIRGFNIA